jgi:Fic family protein
MRSSRLASPTRTSWVDHVRATARTIPSRSSTCPPQGTPLAETLTRPTQAPALVVAAVAHAELAVLRPFTWGSGLLARASTRLVLAARGVDPSLFTIPERGFLAAGRPSYVRALRGYASGTHEGVTDFIAWHADACTVGARSVAVP